MPAIAFPPQPALTIGRLSKRTGVNIETIRYYERAGMLPKPLRSKGGYRVYSHDHVKRLSFVRRGRELGFSLDQLRGLLRLVEVRHYTCAEVKTITLEHLAEVRRKVTDLRRLAQVLSDMAGKCKGGKVPECPIIDALFDARR